jgi:hypothetical protein
MYRPRFSFLPPATPVFFPALWSVWNALYGAQNPYREGHNAVVGLVLNEIISSITNPEARHYVRTAVLEMVSSEVRKLIERSD